MQGEGIVAYDHRINPGVRHTSIPDALARLDVAVPGHVFAARSPRRIRRSDWYDGDGVGRGGGRGPSRESVPYVIAVLRFATMVRRPFRVQRYRVVWSDGAITPVPPTSCSRPVPTASGGCGSSPRMAAWTCSWAGAAPARIEVLDVAEA